MATAKPAEPEAPAEGAEEPKKKKPILLIVGVAVVAVVVLIAVAFGTLYFSGYYEKKAELAAMDKLEELEAAATKANHTYPRLMTDISKVNFPKNPAKGGMPDKASAPTRNAANVQGIFPASAPTSEMSALVRPCLATAWITLPVQRNRILSFCSTRPAPADRSSAAPPGASRRA